MNALVLEGRPVARELRERARGELQRFRDAYDVTPGIGIVQVGDNASAQAYREAIVRAAMTVDLPTDVICIPATAEQAQLNDVVEQFNTRADIHGFLVLQPLPPHLSRVDVADRIDPLKDIDGITTFNAGRLFHDDRDVLAPSTPTGGMALLKHYGIALPGAHAVVVGRSPVVGKPMAAMLLAEHATVTTCHSRTRELADFTRQADILVSAVGRPHTITAAMVKPGATVVDFGVSFVDGQMVGDVDAANVGEVAGALTPVPGGTGRVTTMILIRNTIKAATLQYQRRAVNVRPSAHVEAD